MTTRNDPTALPIVVLMTREDVICVKQAARLTNRRPKTIRSWCKTYGIGRRPAGGAWEVSRLGLEMILHGDHEALELLRRGQRLHPRVRQYAEFSGLSG